MKPTEWYPAHIEPVRDGVYQLLNLSTMLTFYANWHKGAWAIGCTHALDAAQYRYPSLVQKRWPWRGLTSPAA
jgi:hypothetical protein